MFRDLFAYMVGKTKEMQEDDNHKSQDNGYL